MCCCCLAILFPLRDNWEENNFQTKYDNCSSTQPLQVWSKSDERLSKHWKADKRKYCKCRWTVSLLIKGDKHERYQFSHLGKVCNFFKCHFVTGKAESLSAHRLLLNIHERPGWCCQILFLDVIRSKDLRLDSFCFQVSQEHQIGRLRQPAYLTVKFVQVYRTWGYIILR